MSRILIADSYPDGADSTAIVLRCYGYECAVAYSGPEAIDLTLTFAPDVAFLELALKNIDGLEVARRLREHGIIPIALTGYSDTAHRVQAAQAGFVSYLLKPVAFEDLEAVLDGCRGQPTEALVQ